MVVFRIFFLVLLRVFLRKDDCAEAFLPAFPAFAGELLHVRRLVILVNDFQTKYSLNDVFEGDDSLETAVFIYYKGHLLMLLEQLLPDESA